MVVDLHRPIPAYDPRTWMTKREIETRSWRKLPDGTVAPGVVKREAWVLGDLAAVRVSPRIVRWTILHMPSGMAFGLLSCSFDDELKACCALEDISKLRNSWVSLEDKEFGRVVPGILKIAKNYGGRNDNAPAMKADDVADDELNVKKEDDI